MGKNLLVFLGFVVLMATPSFAADEAQGELQLDGDVSASTARDRFTTIRVGTGFRARRTCFDYQGRETVVEGDMIVRVYKAVYWTDGTCDLYY
jgi:hypothetical protein